MWWLTGSAGTRALSPQMIVCGGPEGMFVFLSSAVCMFGYSHWTSGMLGGVETAAWSLCIITKSYVLPGSPNDAKQTLREQLEAKLWPTFPPGDSPCPHGDVTSSSGRFWRFCISVSVLQKMGHNPSSLSRTLIPAVRLQPWLHLATVW